MPTDDFNTLYLLIAFAGGIFGAAIGALPSFILCGLLSLVGFGVNVAKGGANIGLGTEFFMWAVWGPFLGPQISFAGGVAAAAYAAKKKKLETGGRDICSALMGLNAPDVLFVGGIFGVIGYLIRFGLDATPIGGIIPALEGTTLGAMTNSIGLAVVLNAMLARLIFSSKGLLGKVRKGDSRWIPSDVASWLPWQSKPMQLLLIGIAIAVPASFIVKHVPNLTGLAFGISVMVLLFLQFGVKMPVIHHIALSAEVATMLSGNIWIGVGMGIAAVFIAEYLAATFLYHADTHIDPPSFALAVTFVIITSLHKANLLKALPENSSWWIPLVTAGLGLAIMSYLKRPVQALQAEVTLTAKDSATQEAKENAKVEV